MWIKYIITDNRFTIALKYCPSKNLLVVGGRDIFHDVIVKIHNKIATDEMPRITFPNRAMIRYEMNRPMHMFNSLMKDLQKDDTITVLPATNLGRIMR